MNLSQIEQDIYDFVIVPRTAMEIMEFMGHKTPPYGALRFLQRLDLVDKISPYQRAKAKFVQSGRPMKTDPVYVREVQTVMEVQI